MEQDKIDVARATPVIDGAVVPSRSRGAPIWLQLMASVLVIAAAAVAAALFNSSANTMLAGIGLKLPLVTISTTDPSAPPAGQDLAGQRQAAPGPAGQAPGASGQAAAQGQPAGQRQGQGGGGQGQGGGGFAGRGGFGGARTAVVVTAAVTTGKINDQLSAIGEGSALGAVTISAPSGGTLKSVSVKPGDHVEAGAALATLDSDTQQNAYDRASLAAQDAQSALDRAESLASANSIPATQLDAAKLAAGNAKLALDAAQIALGQRTITTPLAGTVGLIQVSPGNQIGAQTVVTTVQDSSKIMINFWVPERYAAQIAVGADVKATSAALPGQAFDGIVDAVDNQIDTASRTLQVQATIPNDKGIIRPGMSFAVTMSFPGETFPAVDPLAIQWSNAGAYVWKVVDGKARKGMVQIVQRNSDGVLVNGDVQPSDQVVTQGVLQLSDGATVRLLDDAAPSAGGPAGAPGQAGQGAPGKLGQGQGQAGPGGADAASGQALDASQGGQGQYQKRKGSGQPPGGVQGEAPASSQGG